jgi:hypothetical protein
VLPLQQEQRYLKQPHRTKEDQHNHETTWHQHKKERKAIKLKSRTAVSLSTQLVHLMFAN